MRLIALAAADPADRERTLEDFKALFAGAGWRFTRVFELQRQSAFKLLEAVPA